MSDSTPHHRLAPPGAGIPAIERLVGGGVLKIRRLLGTPAQFTAHFERERRTIAGLCAGRDAISLGTRVLIPRLRGLEDSSRFWSAWMTLDHLRIVNDGITGVIRELIQGRVPEGVASTATVKPSEQVGCEIVAAYDASCDRLVQIVTSPPMRRTQRRYAHPWFGPLDAAGWHAMSAMHMGIHRAQIERILRDACGRSA
ncbi:MAG: DinB family protein [Phycisphaeraceae bacterium]|nr:DinB family protein [Phycisphaerae bacterium]MBX3393407.1 DinB family protein [Phycisphaeraceae bacterium]